MLEHGPSTDSIPVFVTDGRRRNHAVRLGVATLGLLIAGWLAALAAGLIGFGPLPALSLSGDGASRPATVTPPDATTGHAPALTSRTASSAAPSSVRESRPSSGGHPPSGSSNPSGPAAATSQTTRTAGSGGAPTSGTGTTTGTTPPSDTGAGTGSATPPSSGTGGASQSNSGSEPAWTPPESGGKAATPPRGNSATAPGTGLSQIAPGQASQRTG